MKPFIYNLKMNHKNTFLELDLSESQKKEEKLTQSCAYKRSFLIYKENQFNLK